jgi:NADPH:quinone reductase-like Zn-dependent oxidoreductase
MTDQVQKARAVFFNEAGSAEVLKLNVIDMPEPKEGEVLIKVQSIGLNRADTMYRMGMYVESPVFPAKLGYEAAGIIREVGTGLKNVFQKGDVVSIIPAFSLHQYATYGDYIVAPGYAVQKHSGKLSFDEAAALWTSYLSMYGMLVDAGNIKQGDHVVINAASSSTGLAAIQVVNYCGAIPIALTSSSRKKEGLLNAGAKYVIDTTRNEFNSEILEITNGKGVNIILDPVVGKNFHKLLETITEYGKVFVYGVLSLDEAVFPAFTVLMKTPVIRGYNAMEVLGNPEKLSEAVKFIQKGVEEGAFRPKIDRNFSLNDIVEAHKYMEGNAQFGKVIVNP